MSLSDAKCNATNKGLQVVCTSAAQLGEHMRWSNRPSDRDQFCNRVSFLAVLSCPRMVWQGSVPSGKSSSSSSSSQQQQQQNSNTDGRTDGRPDRKLIRVQGGSSNGVRKTLLFTIHAFPDTFWLYHPLSISQKYFPLNSIISPPTSVVCTPPSLPSPAAERAFTH